MVVNHYISSNKKGVSKVTKSEEEMKKIDKSTNIYFVDGVNGRMITKEEYDEEIAQLILGHHEEEEE